MSHNITQCLEAEKKIKNQAELIEKLVRAHENIKRHQELVTTNTSVNLSTTWTISNSALKSYEQWKREK